MNSRALRGTSRWAFATGAALSVLALPGWASPTSIASASGTSRGNAPHPSETSVGTAPGCGPTLTGVALQESVSRGSDCLGQLEQLPPIGATSSTPAAASPSATSGWNQIAQPIPVRRALSGFAYDSSRGVDVLFGGETDVGDASGLITDANDTWLWNGDAWRQLPTADAPPAREQASMTYDAASGETVLFGGGSRSACCFNDTWAFDGTDWRQQHPSLSPRARLRAALAYDPATQQAVLFGGDDSNGTYQGDTWIWGNGAWSQANPAHTPAPRLGAMLAFDPVSGDLVLFGGYSGSASLGDTWLWNGTDWLPTQLSVTPDPRQDGVLAFDPGSGRLMLGAGEECGTSGCQEPTAQWTWTGGGWQELTTPYSPYGSVGAAAAPDANGHLVVFAGVFITPTENGLVDDTWLWNGVWTLLPESRPVESGAGGGLAYFPDIGADVLYAMALPGFVPPDSPEASPQTWETSGAGWRHISTAAIPPGRMGTSVAYDRNAHELVLFGGYIAALGGSFINYDDTWTFDGVNWTQQHPAASPPSGVDVQLAEDPHGDVVLFGSSGNSTDPSCQTWVWAQGNWLQQQPAHSPPCRQLAGFALDPSSNRDVLFGGLGYPDLTTLLGDTSTWDGTDWSPAASTATPLPRWEMGMAPDVAAHGVLLYGGTNCPALGQNVPYCSPAQTVNAGPDESTYTDTWLWTGGVWQQLSSTPGGPSVFPALASLPDGAGVLAFSGSAIYGDWSTNASWIFGSQPSAPVPEFPAGVGAWALGASAIAALATRRRWRLRR